MWEFFLQNSLLLKKKKNLKISILSSWTILVYCKVQPHVTHPTNNHSLKKNSTSPPSAKCRGTGLDSCQTLTPSRSLWQVSQTVKWHF